LEDKNILFSGNFVSNKEINYKLNINSFENDTIITDNYTNIQNLKINLSENKKTSFSDFCIGIQINNKNNIYEKDYDMDVELEENNYNNYKDIEFENLYTNSQSGTKSGSVGVVSLMTADNHSIIKLMFFRCWLLNLFIL
jgi:hypothetical protein